MISQKILDIRSKISSICQRLGQNSNDISLIGVTKFASIEKIQQALNAGLTHIAENKVQEAQNKFPGFKKSHPNLICHLIGHLQTNKVKAALEVCDVIQSVDRLKLAEAIQKQAEKLNKNVKVLVQVKTSYEEEKFGVAPEETINLIEQITKFNRIGVLGLMTMAPFTDDQDAIRKCFRQLRELRDQISTRFQGHSHVQMKYLSMGMTDDYEIAIEEGSNMVRIGRAIFQ